MHFRRSQQSRERVSMPERGRGRRTWHQSSSGREPELADQKRSASCSYPPSSQHWISQAGNVFPVEGGTLHLSPTVCQTYISVNQDEEEDIEMTNRTAVPRAS